MVDHRGVSGCDHRGGSVGVITGGPVDGGSLNFLTTSSLPHPYFLLSIHILCMFFFYIRIKNVYIIDVNCVYYVI